MATALGEKNVGDAIFPFSSVSLLKHVRRLLTLLGHSNATACTLKGFKAGRATSLAAAGVGLGEILAAGEWRSAAFLNVLRAEEAIEED